MIFAQILINFLIFHVGVEVTNVIFADKFNFPCEPFLLVFRTILESYATESSKWKNYVTDSSSVNVVIC